MFVKFRRGNPSSNIENKERIFYGNLENAIRNNTQFYLFTHLFPDLDSICSNLAMAILVQNINPNARIFLMHEDTLPNRYSALGIILPEGLIEFVPNDVGTMDYRNGITIALDFNSPNRVSREIGSHNFYDKFNPQNFFCLDHHESPNVDGHVYSEPKESSTCSMVYKFNQNLGTSLSTKKLLLFYNLIFFGIWSDTNSLSRPITPEGRNTINMFCSDFDKKFRGGSGKALEIYNSSEDPREGEFREVYLKNIRIFNEYNYVVGTFIDLHTTNKIANKYTKSINGADEMTNIEGTFISFCIDQTNANTFKISFRPCNGHDIDVSKLANQFGGGGHKHMSAATISSNLSIEQLCEDVAIKCHNWLCQNYQVS